jgi:hypothetical protein
MDQLLAVTNTAAELCVTYSSVYFFVPVTGNFLRTLLPLELGKVKNKPTPWSRPLTNYTIPRTTVEPEGSLSRPQETATSPCREPYQCIPVLSQVNTLHAFPAHFFKIHFDDPPSALRSTKLPISLGSPHLKPVRTFSVPLTCNTPRPAHSSWFGHLDNTWWKVRMGFVRRGIKCNEETRFNVPAPRPHARVSYLMGFGGFCRYLQTI